MELVTLDSEKDESGDSPIGGCEINGFSSMDEFEDYVSEYVNVNKINGFSSMDELENYVSEYVEGIEDDKPHTTRYIGIPPEKNANIPEIVAIAKVSKRGTTYVFSNNKSFLRFLNT